VSLKQQILAGAQHREQVHVPALANDDFDGWCTIRPLTEGEQGQVEQAALAGQVVHSELQPGQKAGGQQPAAGGNYRQEIDIAASQKGQRRSRQLAVAYALSVDGEQWKADEVAKLPPAAVQQLYDAVKALTGMADMADEARRFRGDGRGAGGGGAARDGQPAGATAG